MELKLAFGWAIIFCIGLLIVPYGIETSSYLHSFAASSLLIVPYGIETCFKS